MDSLAIRPSKHPPYREAGWMDGQTCEQHTRAEQAAAQRDEADREMKAKGKAGAAAGQRKRPARASSNHSGKVLVRPSFPAGQNAADLRDEDWKFHALLSADSANRETLTAACWYEYARESEHVRQTAERWLEFESARVELWPNMRQQIVEAWISDGVNIRGENVTRENGDEIAKTELPLRAFCRDKRLPPDACERYCELFDAEKEMHRIETVGRVGRPRLRTLATHLIADRPWLLIPLGDRLRAIESAVVSRYDVPKSADGAQYFMATRAFECADWGDVPQFTDEQIRRREDLYHREIAPVGSVTPFRRSGTELLPALIRWGQFSDDEIIKEFAAFLDAARPKEWKHLAPKPERRGRGKAVSYDGALKGLAAMRLRYAFEPNEAFKKFRTIYGPQRRSRDDLEKKLAMDERNFRQRATDAANQLGGLFHSGELPLRGPTWTQRVRDGCGIPH